MMKSWLKLSYFVFLLLPLVLSAQELDPFQWDYDGETRSLSPGESFPLEITFRIPPKHILYKDKMSLDLLEGDNFEVAPLTFSPSLTKKDPFFGREEEVFEGGAVIRTTVRVKRDAPLGEKLIKLQLAYQGCSDKLCYRQMRRELVVPVRLTGIPLSGPSGDFRNKETPFHERGFLLLLLLTFLGGIASDFTPCVLPIIPITLAFIGVRKEGTDLRRNFLLTLFFVFSMAFTYAALGLAAALLGKSLGFLFQSGVFLIFSSGLYLTFALSLLGLFEIQVPLRIRNLMAKWGGEGITGSILSGFTIGFLAAPCVGPLIASLLLYVAQSRNVPKGFILLFSYGLGMGTLFLVIGTFYHQFASKIHGGIFTVWVKRGFAILLLIPAFYYGSVAWSHWKKTGSEPTAQELFWSLNPQEGFDKAAAEGKPVFLDFFASWCLPCVAMETATFSDQELQKLLVDRLVPIKVDCTEETDSCRQMVSRYSIVGWPTFLILSPQGEVMERLVGKNLTARQLKEILEKSLSVSTPHSE